jgi:hypothetical protein
MEKLWKNDLEEVKSVEKCQCGKKCEKLPWKNTTYLVENITYLVEKYHLSVEKYHI